MKTCIEIGTRDPTSIGTIAAKMSTILSSISFESGPMAAKLLGVVLSSSHIVVTLVSENSIIQVLFECYGLTFTKLVP